MRKVVMLNRISIDGFYAGPNGEIDWHIVDPEIDVAVHAVMRPDTLVLGRITYELFAGYWPQVTQDPQMPEEMRVLAEELDRMHKVVFSSSLAEVTWVNTRLVRGSVAEEVKALKHGDGADIAIFGSGTLVAQLAAQNLIDEYLVVVTPVILGAGKTLFDAKTRSTLRLLGAQAFRSGNVLLHYARHGNGTP